MATHGDTRQTMRWSDTMGLALESLAGHRLRTGLSCVAVAIGATAVLLLTSLGDAAKGYVANQFSALGTNLITVSRGRTETSGGMPLGLAATRDLTLEDCEALQHRVSGATEVVPMAMASASVEAGTRQRDVYVFGVTAAFAQVRALKVATGQFLPRGEFGRQEPVVVLGRTLSHELFGDENPIGQSVRIATARFRVIGTLAPKGQSLGFDMDDVAYAPTGTVMRLFDQSGLRRIIVQARDTPAMPAVIAGVREVLVDRHREEDFTISTPDAMLKSFRSILDALTMALAGIAAISLAVAGLGIMNVMLVAVSERVAEVGLLKALGAGPGQIAGLFLAESLLLSALGATLGVLLGVGLCATAARMFPMLPLVPAGRWIVVIFALALIAGGAFGLMPARRAAQLPAAEALGGRRR